MPSASAVSSPVSPAAEASAAPPADGLRHDWTIKEVQALFALPFNDLLFQAASLHRQIFDHNRVQVKIGRAHV